MRHLQTLPRLVTVVVSASLGALALGCSGTPTEDEMSESVGDATKPIVPETETIECVPGIPATSQVPRILNREYDNIVFDLLGVSEIDGAPPSTGLLTDSSGAMDPYMWKAYQRVAGSVAATVIGSENESRFLECDPAAQASCYEDTVRKFGRKIFRRPLSDAEVERFVGLTTITPQGTPDEIAEALLYAFLVSPSFLLVPELSTTPGSVAGAFRLSNHEVAARLAFSLWGSVPDEELNRAADAHELEDDAGLLTQASRMIGERSKASRQIAAAHRAYLKMDTTDGHWWKPEQDTTIYPDYSPSAKGAMRAELDEIVVDVAYSGGGFADLFLTNTGFVSERTAALYGLNPADFGPDLRKVSFEPAESRPGLLTRAGFLSSFSNHDATSPILRGAFITVNVLGVGVGAADPTVTQADIPTGTYSTRRAQIEALTTPPYCAKCHADFINPPGFVLEQYNAVGQLQDIDPLGGPIDSSATVVFNANNIRPISSPFELMEQITKNPKSRQMYAERIVSFATGRVPNPQDACLVDEIESKMPNADFGILDLFVELTQNDSFDHRTTVAN